MTTLILSIGQPVGSPFEVTKFNTVDNCKYLLIDGYFLRRDNQTRYGDEVSFEFTKDKNGKVLLDLASLIPGFAADCYKNRSAKFYSKEDDCWYDVVDFKINTDSVLLFNAEKWFEFKF